MQWRRETETLARQLLVSLKGGLRRERGRRLGGDGAQKGDGSSTKGMWAGHQRIGPGAVELVLTQVILRSAVSRYPVTNSGGTAAVVSSPIRHVTPRPQVHAPPLAPSSRSKEQQLGRKEGGSQAGAGQDQVSHSDVGGHSACLGHLSEIRGRCSDRLAACARFHFETAWAARLVQRRFFRTTSRLGRCAPEIVPGYAKQGVCHQSLSWSFRTTTALWPHYQATSSVIMGDANRSRLLLDDLDFERPDDRRPVCSSANARGHDRAWDALGAVPPSSTPKHARPV